MHKIVALFLCIVNNKPVQISEEKGAAFEDNAGIRGNASEIRTLLLGTMASRGVAVVSGIFGAADIEAECRFLKAEMEKIVE